MQRSAVVRIYLSLGVLGAMADAQNWSTYQGTPPAGHALAAMAFDAARGRCVLFGGGTDEFQFTDETWEFDGAAWTPVHPAHAPSPRSGHSLAYDSWRHRLVLFGGGDLAPSRHDTWEYDGIDWTQIATATAPPGRFGAGMAFDERRRRMVLFGGVAGGTTLADTWEYDGAQWRVQAPATVPPGRSESPLFYDTARGVVAMWGGASVGTSISNDYWEWNGANWTLVPTTNTPSGRAGYRIVFDSVRGVAVLVSSFPSLTAECDSRTRAWTNVPAPLPGFYFFGMAWASAAFDAQRGRMVLSVTSSVSLPADTYQYTPASVPTWTPYGFGCAASAGEPVLSAPPGTTPALGSTLPLQIAPLPAAAGFVVFAFGFDWAAYRGLPLPFELPALPGCALWIDLAGVDHLVPHAGGSASLALPIPALPAFAGQRIGVQGFVADPQAANGLGAVTNAGLVRTF